MAKNRRIRRELSEAERKLWEQAIKDAVPVMTPRPAKPETTAPTVKGKIKKTYTPPTFKVGSKTPLRKPAHNLAPTISEQFASAVPNMDSKAFKRLKKGKLPVDARIDLHGMTVAEAHQELIGFILRAHGAGDRLVLVITGKGKVGKSDSIIPQRQGVLKHQVPHWLRLAPLGPLILEVTQASQKHGGSGAYYVYLRRQR